jgi:hypothetical protein
MVSVLAIILVSGIQVALGVIVGWVLGQRTRQLPALEQPRPVCGCTHHYSMHDPKTGECQVAVGDGECACVRYTGPVPLTEYYAPDITGSGQ